MQHMSMKRKLWITISALCVLGITLVFLTARQIKDNGDAAAIRSAAWIATQAEQTLARFKADTVAFTSSDAVKSGDPARLVPYLNSLTSAYGKTYSAFFVVTRRGKVIAANTLATNGQALNNDAVFARELNDQAWFTEALETISHCEIGSECVVIRDAEAADDLAKLFQQNGKFVTIAAPIHHPRTGEILGMWVSRANWEALTAEWQATAERVLGKGAITALIDKKGKVLFSTDEAATFESLETGGVHRAKVNGKTVWEAATALSKEAGGWTAVSRQPLEANGSGYWEWVAVAVFAIGVLIAGWIVRNALRSFDQVFFAINDQADHLKSAASQLTGASQDLARSATEQASSLQRTASSIDEINSMVNQSAENAHRSAEIARGSQETATRGRSVVEHMIRAIGEISTSNGAILTQVEAGNQQLTEIIKVISEIGNKTKIINDIAFQTKLLSFNASVEAARAGEHGKGFAVVAEEVGSLAQMSANAAKEINGMLEGSIQTVQAIVESSRGKVEGLIAQGKAKIDGGIEVAHDCEKVLEEIVKAETQMNSIITQIAGATREQAQGLSEITKAVGSLDSTTNRNSGIAQQTEQFAEAIASLALALKDEVVEFRSRMEGTVVPSSEPRGVETSHSLQEDGLSRSGETVEMAIAAPGEGGQFDNVLADVLGTHSSENSAMHSLFGESPTQNSGKVIPLRPNRNSGNAVTELAPRTASHETLEETPSESDPRFKEV